MLELAVEELEFAGGDLETGIGGAVTGLASWAIANVGIAVGIAAIGAQLTPLGWVVDIGAGVGAVAGGYALGNGPF